MISNIIISSRQLGPDGDFTHILEILFKKKQFSCSGLIVLLK